MPCLRIPQRLVIRKGWIGEYRYFSSFFRFPRIIIPLYILFRFLEVFDEVLAGNKKITLILDDPAGNSYIESLADDGEPDPRLRIIKYHRSYEQNEELGLNDIKTEGYEEDAKKIDS